MEDNINKRIEKLISLYSSEGKKCQNIIDYLQKEMDDLINNEHRVSEKSTDIIQMMINEQYSKIDLIKTFIYDLKKMKDLYKDEKRSKK